MPTSCMKIPGEYYNARHKDKPITQQEAKRIIAISFSCLTKIEQQPCRAEPDEPGRNNRYHK